jgi:hypothetical protein
MKENLLVSILVVLIGGFFAPSLAADNNNNSNEDNSFVKFNGGIGVIPISNVTVDAAGAVTVTRNTVRGINSPGQIWRIKDLDAKIKTNGDIKVEGKGLVLAGGNGIGRPPAGTTNLFATLICEATAPFTEHSSTLTGVPLAADGDFKIDDVLAPPIVLTDCASPILLIRSAANGNWFAAGIPDLDHHDRH